MIGQPPPRTPLTRSEYERRDAILRAECAAGERFLAYAIPALIGAATALIIVPAAATVLQTFLSTL